jgi:hypothetical protein
MNESSRRIRQASRQAILGLADYTEDDVKWAEIRIIALIIEGTSRCRVRISSSARNTWISRSRIRCAHSSEA